MTTTEELRAWCNEGACVLHVPTGTIDIAKAFFDGIRDVCRNPEPIPGPVFQMGEHTFVATNMNVFQRIDAATAAVFISLSVGLGDFFRAEVQEAARMGVPIENVLLCFRAVLQAQLAKLNVRPDVIG